MTEQLDIFATPLAQPRQRAHRRDAPTSFKAAAKFHARLEGQGGEVLALIRKYPGRTAYELAEKAAVTEAKVDWWRSLICKRAPELERKQFVYRGRARECLLKGTYQTTWYPNQEAI